jgi:predicted nucleic acid-binding Zn ribbon protein
MDLSLFYFTLANKKNSAIILKVKKKDERMPIYEYIVCDNEKGCSYCANGFECKQAVTDLPLDVCPQCQARVRKVFPHVSIGPSKTGLDRRAKESGFHKLKKVDKGKYEKLY